MLSPELTLVSSALQKAFEPGGRRDKEGQNDNDDDRREHDDPKEQRAMDVGGGEGAETAWQTRRGRLSGQDMLGAVELKDLST